MPNLLGDPSRLCPDQVVNASISGAGRAWYLDELTLFHGLSEKIVLDYGLQEISCVICDWSEQTDVRFRLIEWGRLVEDAYVESLDGKLCVRRPDLYWFRSLRHGREEIEPWRRHDDTERSYLAFGCHCSGKVLATNVAAALDPPESPVLPFTAQGQSDDLNAGWLRMQENSSAMYHGLKLFQAFIKIKEFLLSLQTMLNCNKNSIYFYCRIILPILFLNISSCTIADQLGQVGRAPALSPIDNPIQQPGYRPVSLPMPDVEPQASAGSNSLWRSGARSFFRDQRARRVGDILTVQVIMNDTATLSNESTRSRQSNDHLGIPGFFGLQSSLARVLPHDLDGNPTDPENFIEMQGKSANQGRGGVTRFEKVTMDVAAVITQILPNGNLVIRGKQEIGVNFELREVIINGIVRPEDITPRNTIGHEKIAELRVSYGGRGQITDFQQPTYGAQLLDILRPY